MCLATSSTTGYPSARMVLLKEFGSIGFTFTTNYNSRKSQELKQNPRAALVFYWEKLHRQIRIEGYAIHAETSRSDKYFKSRPKGSKLAAIASEQSKVVANRDVFEKEWGALQEKYKDTEDIPRPGNWGGWVIVPLSLEFWTSREFRLHDRVRYYRENSDANWKIERLSP